MCITMAVKQTIKMVKNKGLLKNERRPLFFSPDISTYQYFLGNDELVGELRALMAGGLHNRLPYPREELSASS